jgi:hypothetical protein
MHKDAERLTELLFKEEEEVCVSQDKYAYRSIPLADLGMGSFELTANNGVDKVFCSPDQIKLIALNPIKGERNDENCTAFRTFLVELDEDSLREQYAYVKSMRMPYSACVFSGNKSLHFAITLEEDLPSLDVYRFLAEWILNVMSKADQNTKNPSRMIRFPGTMREEGEQKLLELKDKVSLPELQHWLSQFPGQKPIIAKKTAAAPRDADLVLLPDWVQNDLILGIDTSKGRNSRWFAIAYECGLQGFSEDDTIALLDNFFNEERDFKRREWISALKSGVKKAERTRNG